MNKSCENCRWSACRNYGKEMASCINYIPEIKVTEQKKK